ncbi:hypothetical protein CC85DRAFT_288800 [Cutaneotrichosporon oleaginosum]|uniref:Uncharacterized protein n=1 Tax=Cutaneotrichosporon oleaginosum TaxID=879819 RepID=A0A0J0XDU3_9TREE|nr:uncharacterized protein CC85DRAFT_288800 [Cutaneotrichosporon oleaginosum]KLT39188.1 hypothetical protein CC85DRAFT_288800 [Cutaneotrichosporon oleaginosum]TXT04422.1 hypothetical protein COLE_07241 [Cutaneotrichosporon oleaginosum]
MFPHRGPRPELLPHPIPLLYVSPPDDDSPPTYLLERARRGTRLPSRRPPSPNFLHVAWAPRPPPALLPPKRDPYAPYIPEQTAPSTSAILVAVLLPWLGAALAFMRADEPLLPSLRMKRRRGRQSPLAFLVLLFGGTLVVSATLHACAYNAESDFEIVDPLLLNEPTIDAGLRPPKMGWVRHMHPREASAVASPRDRGTALELHVWDLL